MKQLVDTFIEILKEDPSLCSTLMHILLNEDNGDYLMTLLLECPDAVSRFNIATLIKHVINVLKLKEKDILLEFEDYTTTNEKGETITGKRPKALTTRYIFKSLSLLNT